jgi:hypothetical protein
MLIKYKTTIFCWIKLIYIFAKINLKMTDIIVFKDFESYKTKNELFKYVVKRVFELESQGFDRPTIKKIILDDSYFISCIINNDILHELKTHFNEL